MKLWKSLPFVLAITLLAACSQPSTEAPQTGTAADSSVTDSAVADTGADNAEEEASAVSDEEMYTGTAEMTGMVSIEDEAVALAAAPPPAVVGILRPNASGTQVQKNGQATIDYSNTGDGYVMVTCNSSGKRLKVQVAAKTTYTYDIQPGSWTTFPLSDGNGTYKVTVFENVSGSKYATVLSASFSVSLKDEFEPFLRPNQYVNYENAPNTVAKAAEVAGGVADPLQKVAKVYDYVVANLTYDTAKATSVQSGYLPVLDNVLAAKKGICFDYASLMTGMLRSQGVPCKLVVGYAGTAYHAWINVWTKETGWVDGVIFFDGTTWQRMDPTFASSGKSSESIMKYIGDGSNYKVKYLY